MIICTALTNTRRILQINMDRAVVYFLPYFGLLPIRMPGMKVEMGLRVYVYNFII